MAWSKRVPIGLSSVWIYSQKFLFARIRVSCARSMREKGGGILLKARLKADFVISWGGSKLFSRRASEMCGAEAKDSPTLREEENCE